MYQAEDTYLAALDRMESQQDMVEKFGETGAALKKILGFGGIAAEARVDMFAC
jgi:hypothetical protein